MSQQTPQDIIDDATKQTLAHLKYAQVFNALLLLLIFCVGYIIVFAVVDAWVLPKGNQTLFRILGLSVFLIAIVWQLWRIVRFWLAFRVNPLYVAKTIEDLSPGMKNALINLTCFKMSDAPPPEAAVKLVEFQAARTILRSDLESSTDSARLLRHCIILLAVIAALGLYIVLSPKSFWQSSGRLFMPTAAIESPTRVRIQKVEPGDAQILVGKNINISAEIKGISKSDAVEVIWSSVSGAKTNCRAEMTVKPGEYAYTCTIPDDESGAQEDFTYCVSVGDAVSPQYKVTVLPEPSFSIEQIQYQYPEYTRLEPKTQTDSAEIQALEGTTVTIQIKTNRAVKQAYVKTEPDGRSYRMNVESGEKRVASGENSQSAAQSSLATHNSQLATNIASCSVALRWNEKTNAADQESWSVSFTDELGYENQPLSYPVAVVRDKPPIILKTVEQTITIPPGSVKKLPIRVQDPDFGVGKAELEFQKCIIKDGQTQWSKKVVVPLYSAKPEAAPQKSVDGAFTLNCNKWKLAQGDTLIWRIIVQDNKQPVPNETRSEDYCIRIGTEQAEDAPQNPEEQKNEDANNPQPDAQDQNEDGFNSPDTDSNNQDGQPQEDSPEDEQEDGSENGDNAGQQQSGKQDGKQDGQQQDGQQDGQQAGEQNSGGEQGNQAGQEGNQAGQEGNQAGQEGNDGGQEGNQAGQEGNQGGDGDSSSRNSQLATRNSDGGGNSGEPIDPNSNPGDAIEEILKHKQESGGQNGGQNSSQPGEGQQDGQQDGEGQNGDNSRNSQLATRNSEDGKGQKDGTGQQDGQEGNQAGDDSTTRNSQLTTRNSEDGDLEDSGQPGEGEDLSGQKAGKSSVGSKDEGGSESEDPNKQLDTKGEKNAGKSGAGSQKSEMHTQDNPVNEIPEGEPIQQGENVKKDEGTEQPSSVGDPTPNDNNGKSFDPEQKGRNKGETANGGGMDSETRGNSNDGGQTPSDQGALGGNSGNEGTGQNAGDKVISDGAPGRQDPNKRAGAGREGNPESGTGDTKDSSTPQNGNAEADGDSSGGDQNGNPMDGTNFNQNTQPREGAGGSIGGGLGETTPLDDLPTMPPASDADDVNVDYAQKQTVLALAHLKDQLDAGDDTLLKRLGWTKEQALEFIRRWEKMFADAKKNPKAKDELAQTLKSLGLRPAGYRATNARNAGLQSPGAVRDAGRTAVPPQWSEAFEAFTSGLGEEP